MTVPDTRERAAYAAVVQVAITRGSAIEGGRQRLARQLSLIMAHDTVSSRSCVICDMWPPHLVVGCGERGL